VRLRGWRISGRCFVDDGRRLVLPAFGAFTGGLDARDPAIRALFPRGFQAHILGRQRIHRFLGRALG
jgi:metallophosphoesterase superfamily enzyme